MKPKRFNKKQRYLGLHIAIAYDTNNIAYNSKTWRTFKGRPYNLSAWETIKPMNSLDDLPANKKWRSTNRVIEENPQTVLNRDEELIEINHHNSNYKRQQRVKQ